MTDILNFVKICHLIVLNHGPNFLIKKLQSMGYSNFIAIGDRETVTWREFELTCFAPFEKHVFHEAAVDNLIDSALAVASGEYIALNTNDNTPSVKSSTEIQNFLGRVDLAMLNYNAAGPYPSCFDNLTLNEKIQEHSRIIERNLDHLVLCLEALRPRTLLPFAGAYVLGGKESHKNAYLGTTTWDECAAYVRRRVGDVEVITLREGDEYDITKGVADKPYFPIDVVAMKNYIEGELGNVRYPYERDAMPNRTELISSLENATIKMVERMIKYGIKARKAVYIKVFNDWYQIYPKFSIMQKLPHGDRLECRLDERLLWRILWRKAGWNNAEIGAHINFIRMPNYYEPDLHKGLQFLHL